MSSHLLLLLHVSSLQVVHTTPNILLLPRTSQVSSADTKLCRPLLPIPHNVSASTCPRTWPPRTTTVLRIRSVQTAPKCFLCSYHVVLIRTTSPGAKQGRDARLSRQSLRARRPQPCCFHLPWVLQLRYRRRWAWLPSLR